MHGAEKMKSLLLMAASRGDSSFWRGAGKILQGTLNGSYASCFDKCNAPQIVDQDPLG